MITFGCNIPLFALAFRDAKADRICRRGRHQADVRDAVRWLNFLDQDDVLGWPLKPLYLKDFDALTPRNADVSKWRTMRSASAAC
jgi:hypothetical protein